MFVITTVATTTVQHGTTVWISSAWLFCTTVAENWCGHSALAKAHWPVSVTAKTYICHHGTKCAHCNSCWELWSLSLDCPQYVNYIFVTLPTTSIKLSNTYGPNDTWCDNRNQRVYYWDQCPLHQNDVSPLNREETTFWQSQTEKKIEAKEKFLLKSQAQRKQKKAVRKLDLWMFFLKQLDVFGGN